jgi:phospholipid/cholesterol/gamma-HCH transport system substrate-binding protein
MSYEVRIGLLAAITIAVTVWGYKFMKGKNLLTASNTYYVEYYNVDQLTATSPVLIRGLRVGTIAAVELSDDLQNVTATLDIDRGIRLAKGTEALVVSTSIMGGKAVVLKTPGACEGSDCHEPGDYLPGRVQGLFESLLGDSDINEYVEKAKDGIQEIFGSLTDSLTSPDAASQIAKSFRDIQMILSNIEGITGQLNRSMSSYDAHINSTLSNVDEFTGMLAASNEDISVTLANLRKLSSDFNDADIGGKAANIMASTEDAVASLDETMAKADSALIQINILLSDMNAGKGTIGKLMKDEELYNNLNSTASNLELLLQDFRLNPKRYVNVSVFGKKQKDYAVPEMDPAHQTATPDSSKN